MGLQNTISPDAQIKILCSLDTEDKIHGLNRAELASALQTRSLTQAIRFELHRLGYTSTYRDILMFDDDGSPLMTEQTKRINNEDGSTEIIVVTDTYDEPLLEQVSRSVEHFVKGDRAFTPQNAKSKRLSGRSGGSVMNTDSWAKLDEMNLIDMQLDTVEIELGHAIVSSDIREIEQRYGLYTGWKSIGHADYKTFKQLKN